MLAHIHHGVHHTRKHLHVFHVKHNVSSLTIGLLIIFALQLNLFYYLGIMPLQTSEMDITMSFAGSTLPNIIHLFL